MRYPARCVELTQLLSSSIGIKQNSMTVNVTVKSDCEQGSFIVFKRLEAQATIERE
jgi:hypothetical protein